MRMDCHGLVDTSTKFDIHEHMQLACHTSGAVVMEAIASAVGRIKIR